MAAIAPLEHPSETSLDVVAPTDDDDDAEQRRVEHLLMRDAVVGAAIGACAGAGIWALLVLIAVAGAGIGLAPVLFMGAACGIFAGVFLGGWVGTMIGARSLEEHEHEMLRAVGRGAQH